MLIPPMPEKCRITDETLASSYETTPPAYRAAIKTAIALSHFHFGTHDCLVESRRSSQRLGISERVITKPVDWAILFIGPDASAAARVASLAILPRLAGVDEVYAFFVERYTNGMLCTLELCGIEDIFVASLQISLEILRSIQSRSDSSGRICCLHEGSLSAFSEVQITTCPMLNLSHKPLLLLDTPAVFDLDVLRFCHNAPLHENEDAFSHWDAIFTDKEHTRDLSRSRLWLTPGCEGFWTFPELTPQFFLERALSINLAPLERQ